MASRETESARSPSDTLAAAIYRFVSPVPHRPFLIPCARTPRLAPVWSHSGRELFYVTRTDSPVALAVSGTPDFRAGPAKVLFPSAPYVILPFHRSFDVAPDDRSFVMLQRSGASGAEANRLVVVLNWLTEAGAKLGGR
jgi:hypothetical protein